MKHVRNIRDLTPSDFDRILELAPNRCYCEIAEEYDVPTHTIKKVIRQHNHVQLKRYDTG